MSPFELKTEHIVLALRHALEAHDHYRIRAAVCKMLAAAHEDSPHLGLDRAVMLLKTAAPETVRSPYVMAGARAGRFDSK